MTIMVSITIFLPLNVYSIIIDPITFRKLLFATFRAIFVGFMDSILCFINGQRRFAVTVAPLSSNALISLLNNITVMNGRSLSIRFIMWCVWLRFIILFDEVAVVGWL